MKLLETERTIITKIGLEDAPFIEELTNSDGWLKFIGDRNIHSITDAENYISKNYISTSEKFGFSYYLVKLKDDTPIGICGFLKKEYLDFPDFGFAYLPEFHNQGYGTEAGKAVLDYGAKEFELDKIAAITLMDNMASMKLLLRLGFIENGTIKMPETEEKLNLFCLSKSYMLKKLSLFNLILDKRIHYSYFIMIIFNSSLRETF